MITGRITTFSPEGRWGFISSKHYFYIQQVMDDTEAGLLLRKALYMNRWNQLEVTYWLGESSVQPGKSAATDISLTDRGVVEARKRLDPQDARATPYRGFVYSYNPNQQRGVIQCRLSTQRRVALLRSVSRYSPPNRTYNSRCIRLSIYISVWMFLKHLSHTTNDFLRILIIRESHSFVGSRSFSAAT